MCNIHLSTSRECGPQKPASYNRHIELCYTSKEPTLANYKMHLESVIDFTYMLNIIQANIEMMSNTLVRFSGSR